MVLPAAMMLERLCERHDLSAAAQADALIRAAVDRSFEGGTQIPFEAGGAAGTVEVAGAVRAAFG